MATLIIKRTSEWNNRLRDIEIYLNGKTIGTIRNGEIKKFEVKSGEYTLTTKIDWCRSNELSLNMVESEAREIELAGLKYGKWVMLINLIILAAYFSLMQVWSIGGSYLIALIMPLFIYQVYYLTIGRKRYLRLTEK